MQKGAISTEVAACADSQARVSAAKLYHYCAREMVISVKAKENPFTALSYALELPQIILLHDQNTCA